MIDQLALDGAESWRPVVGFEGIYAVSSLGRVRRLARAKGCRPGVLAGSFDNHGYLRFDLTDRGRRRLARAHVLVAEAFLGPRPEGQEVRHLNGDPGDPRLANLAYGTHSQNMLDMSAHGRSNKRRTHCPQGHPYAGANLYIDHRGARNCRRCMTAQRRGTRRRARARKAARGELFWLNVRLWGREHGYQVADTGRLSNALMDAYRIANPQQWADAIETRELRAA